MQTAPTKHITAFTSLRWVVTALEPLTTLKRLSSTLSVTALLERQPTVTSIHGALSVLAELL